MSITVNKREVEWVKDETVQELLKRMKYSFPLVIVKINTEVVSRKKYRETRIPKDATVDVIHMISGG